MMIDDVNYKDFEFFERFHQYYLYSVHSIEAHYIDDNNPIL